ncbi:hypothetical protein [Cohnella sp. REN36]|nr:hypothetical protein [Cohnella sp. REN36]
MANDHTRNMQTTVVASRPIGTGFGLRRADADRGTEHASASPQPH